MISLEVSSLSFFIINSFNNKLIFFKIFFISQAFIPSVLIHLNQNYSLSTELPKITFKNIIFFLISLIFGLLTIGGFIIDGEISRHTISFPRYSSLYWIFLLYFYGTFYYLFLSLIKKYRTEKRTTELGSYRQLINFVIPGTVLCFISIQLLPFWGFIHPLLLLSLPGLSGIILFLTFKSGLINLDKYFHRSILFFFVTVLYLYLLLFFPRENLIKNFLLAIPAIIFVFILSNYLSDFTLQKMRKYLVDEIYDVEIELESFVSEMGKFIELEAFSEFLAKFSKNIFRCTKCAIIASKFDVRPYQIIYTDNFSKENLEQLFLNSNSPILETLELDWKILNKFDYPPGSEIYNLMEKYKIYLGIPLVFQSYLAGFILLGGDRKTRHFTKKELRFARLLSVQAAHAFMNIQAIQNAIQSKKMAELGVFASQIAHDFQSFITLVKLDLPESNRLRQHANYMEKLVKDLLNYARPQELKFTPANINHLIDMALDMINIPPKIMVEKHYSENLPLINVDTNEMRRVFINLFENSIRAMHKTGGGRLKITTRPLRSLSKVRRNPWIYIEILDEGEGIPEEFLNKIFDPFFTTHKHEGGNGMGLAIVKQIITRHKGFIDVTSRKEKGTIFNIRLPYLI